jgi:hypothetical protein
MKAFGDLALSVFISVIIAFGILLVVHKYAIATFMATSVSVFFSLAVPFGFVLARRQIKLRRVHAANVFRDTYDSFLSSKIYFEFLARKYFDNSGVETVPAPAKPIRYLSALSRSELLIFGASIPFVTLTGFGFLSIFMPFKELYVLFYAGIGDDNYSSFISETGRNNFDIAVTLGCLAFASSFLYSLRLLLRALIAYELSAITMLRAFAHMFFAIMLAVLIWKIAPASAPLTAVAGRVQAAVGSDNKATVRAAHQEDLQVQPGQTGGISNIWLILAFAVGFVPDASFAWLSRRARLAFNRREARTAKQSPVIPLSVIDGIDFLTAFRLEEGGIGCVQNLAATNPVMLHAETSYCIFLVMDWIAQAQLCAAVGPDRFLLFKKMNVRTIFDLEQCVLGAGSPAGLKQIAGSVLLATSPARPSLLRDFAVRPLDIANRDFDKAMASWVNIEVIEQLVRVIMDSLHIQRFRQLWRDLEGSLVPAKAERAPRIAPRLAASNGGGRDAHAADITAANKTASKDMQTEIYGE